MAKIIHVKKDNWQALVTSKTPILLDFWAEWCGPCHMLAPTFARLAEAYGETVSFAKVDVDEYPELAGRYGIRGIPTLLMLREGRVVERLVGIRPYEELAQLLERHAGVTVIN